MSYFSRLTNTNTEYNPLRIIFFKRFIPGFNILTTLSVGPWNKNKYIYMDFFFVTLPKWLKQFLLLATHYLNYLELYISISKLKQLIKTGLLKTTVDHLLPQLFSSMGRIHYTFDFKYWKAITISASKDDVQPGYGKLVQSSLPCTALLWQMRAISSTQCLPFKGVLLRSRCITVCL